MWSLNFGEGGLRANYTYIAKEKIRKNAKIKLNKRNQEEF